MTFMGTFSNAVLNHLIAGYSDEAVAGIGIAKKIDLMAYAVSQGMTQGVLPLIAYNFASGNRGRMKQCIRVTFWYSLILASAIAVLIFVTAEPLSRAFIADAATVSYSRIFLRIICLSCPTSAVNFIIITVFQATRGTWQPVALSLLRKGGLDTPLMFLFDHLAGVRVIAWATPIADWIVLAIGIGLFLRYMKAPEADAPETR